MAAFPHLPALVAAALLIGLTSPGSADELAEKTEAFQKSYKLGENYYSFCMFCHARNGKGTPLGDGTTMAPPLAGSQRVLDSKDVVTRIVLHGLTGKVDGVVYEKNEVAMQPPPPLMLNDDRIMAGLLTYIRNSWGNKAPAITAEEVKAIRTQEAGRDKQWTLEELARKFGASKGGEKPATPTSTPDSR